MIPSMGKYGFYVWSAYGSVVLVFVIWGITLYRQHQRQKQFIKIVSQFT
jgi:heme exporter protein CcmD